MQDYRLLPSDPPFLAEMAHYEWVELALDVADAVLPEPSAFEDILAVVPQLSPLAWSLSYGFPVHRIGPAFRPIAAAEPTYLVVLAVSLVLTIAWTPQSPLADSLALSGVRRFGSAYAGMRICGSISFLCANLGGGYVLSYTGAGAVPALITIGLLVAVMIATTAMIWMAVEVRRE